MKNVEHRTEALIARASAKPDAGFSNADAWLLGSAMAAAAIERALPVTIDIRRHGQQLFHVALPGTTAENDSIRHQGRGCGRHGHRVRPAWRSDT